MPFGRRAAHFSTVATRTVELAPASPRRDVRAFARVKRCRVRAPCDAEITSMSRKRGDSQICHATFLGVLAQADERVTVENFVGRAQRGTMRLKFSPITAT